MSNRLKFDPKAAFGPANKIALEQESQARLLLWDQVSEKAASNEKFRKELVKDPEKVIRLEAGSLIDETGRQIEIGRNSIDKLAEKARKTYSIAVPDVPQDMVEKLIFGTIEDMRTSFKLTLLLSQVLFYSGLCMVLFAFVVALLGGKNMISLMFGSGGIVSVLLSSLVLSPLNRVQNAAGDLVQLQMAYLAYYKQACLLGRVGEELPNDVAIEYAREIDRAANSLISAIQSKAENIDNKVTHLGSPQKSEQDKIKNSQFEDNGIRS